MDHFAPSDCSKSCNEEEWRVTSDIAANASTLAGQSLTRITGMGRARGNVDMDGRQPRLG